MARRGFLWYLFSQNRLPLYVDDNGSVVEGTADYLKLDGQPAHLEMSPMGWRDTLVKYARNTKYWGLNRDLTVPMIFPGDGFKILKKMMWALGYEGLVYLGAMKLNRLDLPYRYDDWYLVELNLVRYKQNKTSVRVEGVDGGMNKLLKAFENTEFEIPIDDDPEAKLLLMDGVPLEMTQEFEFLDEFKWGEEEFYSVQFINPVVRKNPDGLAPYIQMQDAFADLSVIDNNIYKYLVASDNWFIRMADNGPDAGIPVRIKGRLDVKQLTQNDNEGVVYFTMWHVYKDDTNSTLGARPESEIDLFTGYIEAGTPRYKRYVDGVYIEEIVFDFTLTLKPGDRIFFGTRYFSLIANQKSLYTFETTSEIVVNYTSRFKSTYIKGLTPARVLEKLVDKIKEGATLLPTDNGLYYKSDWLAGKRDLLLTSGDAIRGIPGSVLKTSIESFFKSLNFYSVAAGVENEKIFIEPLKYVFKDELLISLGEVDNPELEVAEDLLFNTLKVGGPTSEYDDVNGRYEFNQAQYWATKNTKAVRELDMLTPYRRDCYGAEFTRINLEGKVTTDNKSDNDVWMLNIETNTYTDPVLGEYKKLNRPNYVEFSGAPEGVFNTELTPKKQMLNAGAFLHSLLDLQDPKSITLTNADKNKDLITHLTTRVVEKEPTIIGTLSPKLFLPYYINFTTKVPVNLLPLMKAKAYCKIEFLVNGRKYYGYLMDGGVKPAMNDKQVWKVLAAPNNDFSKFYDPI